MSQIIRHELLMNDQCLQNNNQGSLVTNKKYDTCYFSTFDDHHDTSIVNRPSTALSDRYDVTPWDSGIRSTSAALRTNAAFRTSAPLVPHYAPMRIRHLSRTTTHKCKLLLDKERTLQLSGIADAAQKL